MAKQIILNDRDVNKDAALDEFLKQGSHKSFEFLKREVVLTDSDYENIFTKIAAKESPTNFTELKDIIHDTFDGKLDEKLDSWGDKLVLDRTRLNEVFKSSK
jgi:hypothetical protein